VITNKTIAFDIDGIICQAGPSHPDSYYLIDPDLKVVTLIRELKKNNNKIVIYSARGMNYNKNNMGAAICATTRKTLEWLDLNKIPYDEFWIKPSFDYLIDDKAISLESAYKTLLSEVNK